MYNKIEEKYEKYSNFAKYRKLMNFIYTIYIIIIFILMFVLRKMALLLIGCTIIITIIFTIAVYLYIYFSYKKKNKLKKCSLFKIKENFQKFNINNYDHDVKIMRDILREFKINKPEEVYICINHYQSMLPRISVKTVDFISLMSLVIASIALISGDLINNNFVVFKNTIILIINGALLVYNILVISRTFKVFNNKENLYKEIESFLTEIYLKKI